MTRILVCVYVNHLDSEDWYRAPADRFALLLIIKKLTKPYLNTLLPNLVLVYKGLDLHLFTWSQCILDLSFYLKISYQHVLRHLNILYLEQ